MKNLKPWLERLSSYRFWVVWIGAIAIIGWSWWTDLSDGAETEVRLESLAWIVVLFGIVYLGRRALMDGARSKAAYNKGMETSEGASRIFQGLCILAGLLFIGAVSKLVNGAELPPNARMYLPVLASEIDTHWEDLRLRSVLGAQVEQESCVSLKSVRCWSPLAELKTSREYGFGLGQHTRAYRADGSIRFDRHAEDLARYPAELKEWTWENRYNAKLQLRAVVLGNRDCYRRVVTLGPDEYNAMAFCDAAHNGGFNSMLNDRRICAKVAGCDPDQWFGHVEKHSLKSRVMHPGYHASAFGINREHVALVFGPRRSKYMAWFGEV